MSIPTDFTPEQIAIMVITIEEGYLNEVIPEYNARMRGLDTGSALQIIPVDEEQTRPLIPHFIAVVTDMIERDLIEIREPDDGVWDDAVSLSRAEVDVVLTDPATWIWSVTEPEKNRMVMLMTTNHGDQVIGR
jgi:hypothetical protein